MFFKKNDSNKFINNVVNKNRIPILIFDKYWKELFSNNINKNMEELSNNLKELLEKQKNSKKELDNYKHRKRILMNKIIHLSDRLNSNGEEKLVIDIEHFKVEIEDLNEKINNVYEELEIYPENIKKVNSELLKETVNVAYFEINETESRIRVLEKEIELLRQKLGEHRDEQEKLDKKSHTLYSLLHSILGAEEIEKLDLKFFDE